MSPAEAGKILEEPDWVALFKERAASDLAFEEILTAWRRWHWTPVLVAGVEKKQPAGAVEAMIALAALGVMPPRSLAERPPGPFEEQVDDHCWFTSQGRSWRILGVEDKTLILDSFGEQWQIDLSRAKWEKYTEAAAALLEALREKALAAMP
jgi:hypothetical protein